MKSTPEGEVPEVAVMPDGELKVKAIPNPNQRDQQEIIRYKTKPRKPPEPAFVPTGAFGGLLLLIADSLLAEWLWESRHRFSRPEYAVCLFTFGAIHMLGLEADCAAGLVSTDRKVAEAAQRAQVAETFPQFDETIGWRLAVRVCFSTQRHRPRVFLGGRRETTRNAQSSGADTK